MTLKWRKKEAVWSLDCIKNIHVNFENSSTIEMKYLLVHTSQCAIHKSKNNKAKGYWALSWEETKGILWDIDNWQSYKRKPY